MRVLCMIISICYLVGPISSQQMLFFDSLSMSGATVKNLESINSEDLDFSPIKWKDLLVFVTNHRQGLQVDEQINEKFFDLKFADENSEGTFERDAFFPPIINSAYHEGPCTFTEDGNTMFFTRDYIDKNIPIYNSEKVLPLQIYSSQLQFGKWSEPVRWEHCDKQFSYAHPTLSATGDTLIFSSNQKGGEGKMDLYIAFKEAGKWTKPVNLGPQVNTKANEWFSSLHDGHLYFASEQESKSNDLDIFLFDLQNETTLRLPEPINTSYDDFGYFQAGKTRAYFSSNRPGGIGKDDIYVLEAVEDLIRKKDAIKTFTTFRFLDSKTKNPLANAEVIFSILEDKETLFRSLVQGYEANGHLKFVESGKDTLAYTGNDGLISIASEFPIAFNLESYNAGYEDYIGAFLLQSDSLITIMLEQEPPPLPPKPKPKPVIIKQQEVKKGSVIVFENIYYAYNSHEILPGSAKELDELVIAMIQNPKVKVQLSAHTDARGESLYNQLLSDKRADAAKQYIIQKGINASRIVAIGFGESRIRNQCVDGVECNDDEHQYNRRTEVKILDY